MNEIEIEDLPLEPEDLLRFPDFVLGAMARRGCGLVQASLGAFPVESSAGSLLPWRYVNRLTRQEEVILHMPLKRFRASLARFAFFSGISPYAGHTHFSILWPNNNGVRIPHHFSIFLCNEPSMAFWIRVYLYSISKPSVAPEHQDP